VRILRYHLPTRPLSRLILASPEIYGGSLLVIERLRKWIIEVSFPTAIDLALQFAPHDDPISSLLQVFSMFRASASVWNARLSRTGPSSPLNT
jgi:hypothetical protein